MLAGAATDTQAGAAVVVACTAADMAADMLLVEFVTRTHHALAPGTEEAHKSAAADAPADIDETGTAAGYLLSSRLVIRRLLLLLFLRLVRRRLLLLRLILRWWLLL